MSCAQCTLDPVTDRIELVQVDPNANAQLVLAALQTRQLSHHEIIHAYYQNFVVKASARDFLTRLDGRALQEASPSAYWVWRALISPDPHTSPRTRSVWHLTRPLPR